VGERLRLDAAEQHALEAQVSEILGQSRALGAALRNQHERADTLIGKLELAEQAGPANEARLDDALARAQEVLGRLSERSARVEASSTRLDEYVEKLNRIQGLYDLVTSLSEQWQIESDRAAERDAELERQVKHERQERLDNYAKVQRQFRTVMERFDA
jgi:septal ring factor EnvC (AmiA/AmiB activator)